jgi:LPXTG-motif cell wall-anchored protein
VYSRPDKSLIVVGTAATFRGSFAKTSSAPRVPSDTAPTPADLIAAQHAAGYPSASLDRFALISLHKIPPATTSGNSNPEQFHFGDAAIGAGITAGLVLLGIAGLIAARRRRQPLHT